MNTDTASDAACSSTNRPRPNRRLLAENRAYGGTGGVSAGNRHAGFLPAFRHKVTGRIYRSRFPDGTPAPIHVLEGLPAHIRNARQCNAGQHSVADVVESGFVLMGRFFSRREAADVMRSGCGRVS